MPAALDPATAGLDALTAAARGAAARAVGADCTPARADTGAAMAAARDVPAALLVVAFTGFGTAVDRGPAAAFGAARALRGRSTLTR